MNIGRIAVRIASKPQLLRVPRSSFTTLSSAKEAAGKSGGRVRLEHYVGALLVGAAVGLAVDNYAKSDEGSWKSMKENIMTSYERKIRDLSSPEKCFSVFASVTKDGKKYMTADDFIRALVPYQFRFESKSDKQKRLVELPAAFKIADQNGDGLLSFQEYLFFVTLLSIPEDSFEVAFKLMDEDGNGKVDQDEFMKVMSLVKKLSPPAVQTTHTETDNVAKGWLDHFFGPKGNNMLTFEAFTSFLRQLNSDVLRMEYNLYDREKLGYLSQRDFGLLLVSFANPKTFFDRTDGLSTTPLKPFSFEQFQAFNTLVEHLDELEMGMQLYQLNNRPFLKQDLQRLSRIVCKVELNPQVADTIMHIFDKNRDGSLEVDEFVTAMKKRKTRGLATERDTGFTSTLSRFIKCIKNDDD